MSITSNFLRGVLDEYEKLLNENPRLRTERDPGTPLTKNIHHSLDEVTNVVTAMKWLEENSKTECSSEERSYYLYLLLRRLDEYFSDRPLVRDKISNREYIISGRRWWDAYARCMSGAGVSSGPPFSAHSGFPRYLRNAEHSDEEWFEGGELAKAFESAMNEGFLRVGLCSLSGKFQTQFGGTSILDRQSGTYGFCATCISEKSAQTSSDHPDPDYIQELRECVKWARDNRIHVLCFPELSVCPDGRQAIQSEIAADAGSLCLVVPGSYHDRVEDGAGLWVNIAPIWLVLPDTSDGIIELARFEKSEPFSMKTGKALEFPCISDAARKAEEDNCSYLQEHIRPGEMTCVLKTPVGVFGIVICKDQLAWRKLVERYGNLIDHMLVISMNFSPSAWFWSESENFARDHSAATFYVNATHTVDPDDSDVEMVFWNIPSRLPEEAQSASKEKYYRSSPSAQPHGRIKQHQLPEDGRVYFEIEIPPELLHL